MRVFLISKYHTTLNLISQMIQNFFIKKKVLSHDLFSKKFQAVI